MELNIHDLDNQVAEAFGVDSKLLLLPGGSDLKTFRSGEVVLRNLGFESEEAGIWNAELFDRLQKNGFRIAKPIKAKNGKWIVNGWVAEHFLEGKHATNDDLPKVIEAVVSYHKALEGIPLPEYRKKEQTMYDRADQWAWGEIPKDIDPKLLEVLSGLIELRKLVDLPSQLIHGDLNLNNILVADNLPPAIIDLAPYWRPAEFALAVMAYWVGPYEGNMDMLKHFKNIKEFDQMLIRAGLRMALIQKDPHNDLKLEEYKKASDSIVDFVSSHAD
jgi:uncharacterized protein (TIGR02569 family)